MAVDQIQEARVFPVNSSGEILVQRGVGVTSRAGDIPSSAIPIDITTNKMVMRLPDDVAFAAKSLRGAAKWFGAAQNGNTFNETAGVFTLANYGGGQKIEAEAPFNAVRLFWISRVANAMTASKSLIAVTETADVSVAATAFQPVISGTTYNTAVTFPSTLGWRAVTWAGASTVDHPAANLAAQVKVSDWMNIDSVPRADGGTRPLLLIRNEHDGASQGGFATFSNSSIAVLRNPIQAFRGRVLQTFTGTNMVSSVGSVNGAIGTATYEVYPEFRYNVPSLSVCGVADSISQNESLGLTGGITSWGARGCYDASSLTRPVNWVSCNAAGKQFSEFWQRFLELSAAGYVPDVLVIAPLSINDWSGDTNNFSGYIEQAKSRAQLIHEFAQTNKIRNIVYIGHYPWSSISLPNEVKRLAWNAWLATFATNTGQKFLDFSVLSDGNGKWNSAYNRRNGGGGTATITINSPLITVSNHGRNYGDSVEMNSTGLLPTGIPNGQRLFINSTPDANTFTLSLTLGGQDIIPTGSQSGTVTMNFSLDAIHPNEFAIDSIMAPTLTAILNTLV